MQYWWIFLDYKNCKCRTKLADKLIDECTEIVKEIKLAEVTPFENKNNSCKVYITLMIVAFAIFIGITVYLICYSRFRLMIIFIALSLIIVKNIKIWWMQLNKWKQQNK